MNGKFKATRHFLLAVTFVATSVLSAFAQISPCLVEAEAFADKGGWVVDPQFVEQMGSPYLLAHGKGVPVADARTQRTDSSRAHFSAVSIPASATSQIMA